MFEYRVINCLGLENVTKAIEDRQAEDPEWMVHSITTSGVEEHQLGGKLEMQVQIVAVPRFVLLMERLINDESLGRGVNPGGIRLDK
jgi:hypothetical protein